MNIKFVVTDRKVSATRMSDSSARTLREFKSGFFNRKAVLRAIGKEQAKRMAQAGDYLATTAQRSMRYRKRPSLPGQPPSANPDKSKAKLRQMLFFAFDMGERSGVVGSAKLGQSSVPYLQEHGGVRRSKPLRPRQVGGSGPIRIVSKSRRFGRSTKPIPGDREKRMFVYAKIKTPRQAARATGVEASIFTSLDRRYPARPFLEPATEAAAPGMNEILSRPL